MEESNGLKKVLKWAGIAALVAIPFLIFIKKRRGEDQTSQTDEESSIFDTELEG